MSCSTNSASKPEHAVASAGQHSITSRIRVTLLGVVAAIDLDHEPFSRRQEISDEAAKQRRSAPPFATLV